MKFGKQQFARLTRSDALSSDSTETTKTARVFISATSPDLGSARQIIKEALLTLNCMPIEQTNFPPDHRDLPESLREKIKSSDAIVHLVGFFYGAEPRSPLRNRERRSYTQLEYDFALELKKPIYCFICREEFDFDVHKPEISECVELQAKHREKLTGGIARYTRVGSKAELSMEALKLRVEVESLQNEIATRARRTQWSFYGSVCLILLVVAVCLGMVCYHEYVLPKRIADEVMRATQNPKQIRFANPLDPKQLDTSPIQEVANLYKTTPEYVQKLLDRWITSARRSSDFTLRSKAEFLSRDYTNAAILSDKASNAKIALSKNMIAESRQTLIESIDDLNRAGRSYFETRNLNESLSRFEQALDLSKETGFIEPQLSLYSWIGTVHIFLMSYSNIISDLRRVNLVIDAFQTALTLGGETTEKNWEEIAIIKHNLGYALIVRAEKGGGTGWGLIWRVREICLTTRSLVFKRTTRLKDLCSVN